MLEIPSKSIDIPLEEITLGKSQARQRDTKVDEDDDLVHSIRKNGLITPIIVKKIEDRKYELLVGQRRFRAHEILKKSTIRAQVMERDIDEFEAKKISLIENAARKDMKHADYMDTIQMFMEKYNGRVATVAEELGLSTGTVSKYFSVSNLPENVKSKVREKKISPANAIKALNALGGEVSEVNEDDLLETAEEMQKLSPQSRKKFVEIKKHEEGISTSKAVEQAKKRVELHHVSLDATDDQLIRIEKFKEKESIEETGDAVSELVDLGLDASDV